jgi:integrase
LEALRAHTAHNPFQLALLGVSTDTLLRSSDLLALRLPAVLDASGAIRETFETRQQKDGGRTVLVSLTPKTREALAAYIAHAGLRADAKLFPICARTFRRMVQGWARALGLNAELYSGHSMRRSKAAIIYEATKDVRRIQLLLGHKFIGSSQNYLGAEVADSIELALKFDI